MRSSIAGRARIHVIRRSHVPAAAETSGHGRRAQAVGARLIRQRRIEVRVQELHKQLYRRADVRTYG